MRIDVAGGDPWNPPGMGVPETGCPRDPPIALAVARRGCRTPPWRGGLTPGGGVGCPEVPCAVAEV